MPLFAPELAGKILPPEFTLFPQKRNIVSVVVENSHPAREFHQGVEDALMVQEYPVEGLITRFVLLFDRKDLPKTVGPVRSLRPYFVDGILPWSHAIFFAGGSPEAFDRAYSHSELLAVNGLAYGEQFYRTDAPAPHDLFVDGEDLLSLSADVRFGVRWPPYKMGSVSVLSGATVIEVDYHSILSNHHYEFSAIAGTYERTDGDIVSDAHPANIVMLEAPITGVGEHGRLTIPLKGGPLLLFRSGSAERGTWEKSGIADGFRFLDARGKDLRLNRGQTWITVLPNLDRVSWE